MPGFNPYKFNLLADHFDNQSSLHGIKHTYRVMCHVRILGQELKFDREIRLAFCAAFIHDMARRHDGFCRDHGFWAAQQKLPLFGDFFLAQGVNSYEIEEIGNAVKNHSEGFELAPDDAFWKTTALLKDADALDRIRMGVGNLKTEFLRFPITEQYIPFANLLYEHSNRQNIETFMQMQEIANRLLNSVQG